MTEPALSISSESVCFLIVKARGFDVQDVEADEDSSSNPADDRAIDVLEDHGVDPTAQEIAAFVEALSEDEQVDLVALMRLGRGDGTLADWDDLRNEAYLQRDGKTASYLMGEPMVADYLEEGLSQFGLTCEDVEMDRL
ncbi:MAG: DUF3775 domain-containing protein [Enhydrobacter sp.]|nr:MAG: DUF3775 domain-containing protein [Enhydrobacter sp.]